MMGMETQPELNNPPKESDFVDRISLSYVGWVDSGFFGRIFGFSGLIGIFSFLSIRQLSRKRRAICILRGIMVNQSMFYLVPGG